MFLPSISLCEDDSHDEVSGLHEAEARKALREQQARAANIDKVQAGLVAKEKQF